MIGVGKEARRGASRTGTRTPRHLAPWCSLGMIVLVAGATPLARLAATPYAVGVVDLGVIRAERRAVKALRLNGAAPTEDDVASGRYPLVTRLVFVFRAGRLAWQARSRLNFVRSTSGQQILRAHDDVPDA